MYYFMHLEYFLLLIPIFFILVFLYFKWWKNIVFSNIKILNSIFKRNAFIYKIYYLLLFFIFIFYISIFSNLVIREEKDEIIENWIDIQIVLDISYSMLAEDFSPNRLEASKNIISKFMKNLSWDRLWLIVFAWKPFTSLPLNFDYSISEKIIKNISVNTINQNNSRMQGTAVWDAIIIASEWFDEKSIDREKIIILLTDWESNVWLNPIKSIEYLEKSKSSNDIKIYTIWIWWENEAFIKTKDIFWREISTKVWWLNEKILQQISQKTWWKYFRASDINTLDNVFETISKLEKKEILREKIVIEKEKNLLFVYVLMLLFFSLFILKYKKNI